MKQAEKDEKNRADRARLKGRIPELQERRATLSSKINAVSLESAMGDAAAVKVEAAAKAEIAQIDGQVATIQTAIERLEREYVRDEPARQAEARENARALLEGHSLESLRLAEAFVDSLHTAAQHAESYEHHRLSTDGDFRRASGGAGHSYTRPASIADMIFIALKEAGFGKFDPKINSAADVGMVAQNAAALRSFAPEHPACKVAQERAEAFLAAETASQRARLGLDSDMPPWPGAQIEGRRKPRRVMGAEVVEPERIWSGKTPKADAER